MDLLAIFISFMVGLLLGGAVVFMFSLSANKNKASREQTESELKSLLAVQARDHIDSSTSLIAQIQNNTEQLKSQVQAYEASLNVSDFKEDDSKSTFYGEHASVYLRNSVKPDKSAALSEASDAPPLDFSNNASGLFAGAPVNEEKTSK